MTETLKRYLALEGAESAAELVPTVPDDVYTPLTPERVAELLAARPDQSVVLNHDAVHALIERVWFNELVDPKGQGKSVACTIKLKNGFELVGIALCMSEANHNRELGEHFAFQKAYSELCTIGAYMQMEEAYRNPRQS